MSRNVRLVSDIRAVTRRRRKAPPATSAVRGYIVPKDGHEPVPYQSDLERQFLVVCGCLPWVERVTWEPFTLQFFEIATLLERSYTPDFLVRYQDGCGRSAQFLIETKREIDQRRSAGYMAACYDAASAWAEGQDETRFFLASDAWLQRIGLANFEFIYAARKGAAPTAERREMVKALLNQTELTMASAIQLLNAQGLSDHNRSAATLMALVSDGYLGFDVSVPLTMETPIDVSPLADPFAAAAAAQTSDRQAQVRSRDA